MNFSSRRRQTSQKCPDCDNFLEITRDCHTARMYCSECQKFFPLKDFISNADKSMEEFLENLYVDRI